MNQRVEYGGAVKSNIPGVCRLDPQEMGRERESLNHLTGDADISQSLLYL